jgi:DeoR/GlpR family transcriptional regulator of sugar metabolism
MWGVHELLAVSRRKEIIEILHMQQAIMVPDLSKRYGLTEETIRKDLEKLEKAGLLKRTHGGAVKLPDIGQELPFSIRNATNMNEKKRIAIEAAKLVNDYDVIALDPSSTSLQLAYQLRNRRGLTVVTNSLNVLETLKENTSIHVFCTGGSFHVQSLCFVGEAAEEMIKKHVIDKVFLSSRGLTLSNGLLEPNEHEARMKKVFIEMSKEVVLLQDHSKFAKSALYPIASLERIDCLITDDDIPQEYREKLAVLEKKLIIARSEGGGGGQ